MFVFSTLIILPIVLLNISQIKQYFPKILYKFCKFSEIFLKFSDIFKIF